MTEQGLMMIMLQGDLFRLYQEQSILKQKMHFRGFHSQFWWCNLIPFSVRIVSCLENISMEIVLKMHTKYFILCQTPFQNMFLSWRLFHLQSIFCVFESAYQKINIWHFYLVWHFAFFLSLAGMTQTNLFPFIYFAWILNCRNCTHRWVGTSLNFFQTKNVNITKIQQKTGNSNKY